MYTLTPQIIAEVTGGKLFSDERAQNIPVSGAVRDNRDVKPGNLFVCICGERTDGHLYANDAFKAGAVCCLAEKEIPDAKGTYVLVSSTLEAIKTLAAHHRSQFNIPIIGITGSVGKTTTKELIAAALGAKLNVLKTEKNLNNELGVPLTLLSLDGKHDAAVIEMGISDFGEMGRLAKMVLPDIFVMTAIGYSHTKELGDLQGVLRAKTEAFAYMKPDGIAVMNGDDSLLAAYSPKIRKVTFGTGNYNDFRAENVVAHGAKSIAMEIASEAERFPVKIPAYGGHLAELAPAAAAVGRLLGLSDTEISAGLSTYSPVEGRSIVSVKNSVTLIDDCYNANPSSIKAALTSLSKLTGRRVAILGDMLNLGSLSDKLHFDVGRYAAQCGIDVLLCLGDGARYIIDGYKDAGGARAEHYPSMDSLESDISRKIAKGDAVLVKASHGMGFSQIVSVISDWLSQ